MTHVRLDNKYNRRREGQLRKIRQLAHDPVTQFHGYSTSIRRCRIAGSAYDLLAPDNPGALLDDPRIARRFYEKQDEYLPYWAEIWPASLLLAGEVAQWAPAPAVDPPAVLDLGCGVGLVSLIAAKRGYAVIAGDYEPDALAFVLENARLNDLPTPRTRHVDWRESYDDLRPHRMVAADVTYEARNLEPVAKFVRQHLRSGGFALLSDPNRAVADPFPGVARAAGLTVDVRPLTGVGLDGQPIEGRVFELRREHDGGA